MVLDDVAEVSELSEASESLSFLLLDELSSLLASAETAVSLPLCRFRDSR